MKSYPRPPDIREYDTREGWALDSALARHRWERRRVWRARFWGFAIGAGIAAACWARADPAVRHYQSEQRARCAAFALAPLLGGFCVETIGSSSMRPLIKGRAFAVLVRGQFDRVKVGELVEYLGQPWEGHPMRCEMLHRVAGKLDGRLIMKGDNWRNQAETWALVGPKEYHGTVLVLMEWPQ